MTPRLICIQLLAFFLLYLTMCSPSLFMDFTWKVEEDLHGSNHFPITLESHYHPPDDRPPKWQFHKAVIGTFLRPVLRGLSSRRSWRSPTGNNFIDKLCEIGNKTIPKSNPKPKNPHKPWFSDECKQAILDRKRCLKEFLKDLQRMQIYKNSV